LFIFEPVDRISTSGQTVDLTTDHLIKFEMCDLK